MRGYLDSGLELRTGSISHRRRCLESGFCEEVLRRREGEEGFCEADGMEPVAHVLDLLGREEEAGLAVLQYT